jgi:hypothetical protein
MAISGVLLGDVISSVLHGNSWILGTEIIQNNTNPGIQRLLTSVSLTDELTTYNSALQNGIEGTVKILLITGVPTGSKWVLTPDNFGNGTRLEFTHSGQSAWLVWTNGGWWLLGGTGAMLIP